MGSWTDGLITTSRPKAELTKMIAAYHRGGGEGKPIYLKVGLSYAATKTQARENAFEQWRCVAFANHLLTELRTPAEFEAAGARVRAEDMDSSIRISDSVQEHVDWLQADLEAGVKGLILHNIGKNQEEFIDTFGSKVIPELVVAG
jgi:alkanesulfonate monooxygenase SsuD/methylene tetrahydromethanopterin reductase-like flavin-dependent oxidoreductase (luciferase family)